MDDLEREKTSKQMHSISDALDAFIPEDTGYILIVFPIIKTNYNNTADDRPMNLMSTETNRQTTINLLLSAVVKAM